MSETYLNVVILGGARIAVLNRIVAAALLTMMVRVVMVMIFPVLDDRCICIELDVNQWTMCECNWEMVIYD